MIGSILNDPLNFMEHNIIVPSTHSLGDTQDASGQTQMCLTPKTDYQFMNGGMERVPSRGRRLGKDVAVLSLGKFKGDPKAVLTFFPAFWCPYAPNETFTCKLDSSANFCFTTTMSGCSFGARKDGDQGQWTVAHANTQRDGGNTEQMATAQAAKLTEKLGDAATIIGPGHYRNDHNNAPVMNANTFGLRKDGE